MPILAMTPVRSELIGIEAKFKMGRLVTIGINPVEE
jgi:hypothetical protein